MEKQKELFLEKLSQLIAYDSILKKDRKDYHLYEEDSYESKIYLPEIKISAILLLLATFLYARKIILMLINSNLYGFQLVKWAIFFSIPFWFLLYFTIDALKKQLFELRIWNNIHAGKRYNKLHPDNHNSQEKNIKDKREKTVKELTAISAAHPEWNMTPWWEHCDEFSVEDDLPIMLFGEKLIKVSDNGLYYIDGFNRSSSISRNDVFKLMQTSRYHRAGLCKSIDEDTYKFSVLYSVKTLNVTESKIVYSKDSDYQSAIDEHNRKEDNLEKMISYISDDPMDWGNTFDENMDRRKYMDQEKYDLALDNEHWAQRKYSESQVAAEHTHSESRSYYLATDAIFIECGAIIFNSNNEIVEIFLTKEKQKTLMRLSKSNFNKYNTIYRIQKEQFNLGELPENGAILSSVLKNSPTSIDIFTPRPSDVPYTIWGNLMYYSVYKTLLENGSIEN